MTVSQPKIWSKELPSPVQKEEQSVCVLDELWKCDELEIEPNGLENN